MWPWLLDRDMVGAEYWSYISNKVNLARHTYTEMSNQWDITCSNQQQSTHLHKYVSEKRTQVRFQNTKWLTLVSDWPELDMIQLIVIPYKYSLGWQFKIPLHLLSTRNSREILFWQNTWIFWKIRILFQFF